MLKTSVNVTQATKNKGRPRKPVPLEHQTAVELTPDEFKVWRKAHHETYSQQEWKRLMVSRRRCKNRGYQQESYERRMEAPAPSPFAPDEMMTIGSETMAWSDTAVAELPSWEADLDIDLDTLLQSPTLDAYFATTIDSNVVLDLEQALAELPTLQSHLPGLQELSHEPIHVAAMMDTSDNQELLTGIPEIDDAFRS
jgi:hypothetical protein